MPAKLNRHIMPYFYLMRLHRPLPILLILWPTYWALWVASNGQPSFKLIIIFGLGVFIMRTVGCIFNDVADRDFDGKVERTKTRPLATGELKVSHALILALILGICAFLLVLLLNSYTIYLSFLGLGLTLFYPLCKRFFFMPQFILGLAFNFGIIMVYAAVKNTVPLSAYLLYIIAIVWTLAYDSMYALADLPYDKQLGLKSSVVFFGRWVNYIIVILQILMLLMFGLFAYIQNFNGVLYGALILCAFFFAYQYQKYSSKKMIQCIQAFSNNHWVGFIIFLAILLQY